MGALTDIEALIASTSFNNEVKASGSYWYQPTGGLEIATGEWSDEGGGWIIQNNLDIYINDVLVFGRTEEQVVNFNAEEYKILVLKNREEFLEKMLAELIALGY